MRKCLILTLLCLFTSLLLFGYFNAIEGSSENAAALKKAWKDAEKAIKVANDRMHELDRDWERYSTEYSTIIENAVTSAFTMWSASDVAKGLVTVQGPQDRLFALEALMYMTIIYMDDLNKILQERVSTRDTALTNYNSATSQQEEAIHSPEYRTIPECCLPCRNTCGVIFSSLAVGLDGLSHAADSAHKETCPDPSGSPPGCSKDYWTCNGRKQDQSAKHQKRRCGKWIDYSEHDFGPSSGLGTCRQWYRNCTNPRFKHFNLLGIKTKHGEDREDNQQQQIVAPDPAPTPTPSYHTCGSHETWQSGDHSAAGCGTSGHYVCDGSDHSYTYCYVTDSNGNTCTVGSYYVCDYHTHVYPAPPPTPSATCARSACGQTVSDRLEHRQTCAYGHTYWTCYPDATHNHTTTFTCRRPGCGVTFTRCSNGTCTSDWGTHNYHWASD